MEEEIDYKRECEVKELQLHLLREEKDNEIKKLERYINNRCIPISLIEKEIEEYEEIGMIGVADCMKRLLNERNNTDEH